MSTDVTVNPSSNVAERIRFTSASAALIIGADPNRKSLTLYVTGGTLSLVALRVGEAVPGTIAGSSLSFVLEDKTIWTLPDPRLAYAGSMSGGAAHFTATI